MKASVGEIAEQADQPVVEADVDQSAAPGQAALVQGCENRHRPENPADHVPQGDAELDRQMTAFTVDAERPGQRLGDDVE